MRRPKLNKFDLSHERKMTLNMGDLVPIMNQEMLPGDRFRVNTEIMARMQPLLAPIMHRVNVTTHYFFVPYRILWTEWEDFITGGKDGTAAPVHPYIPLTTANMATGVFASGTLWDYMGLPSISDAATGSANIRVSALPFRAYGKIYNEWFRDENLIDEIDFGDGSGDQTAKLSSLTLLRKRAWEKDYFTSALPEAQRGPDVLIPVEGEVDIEYSPFSTVKDGTGNPINANKMLGTSTPASLGRLMTKDTVADFGSTARIENIASATVNNVQTTIRELRRAESLQEWLEIMMRAGARYTEQIRAIFGVTPEDSRLQRPEYLGGAKQPMVISEVLSTFQDAGGEGDPQGNMSGHGVSTGNRNGFTYRAKEHGVIIGVMSILPRTAYQNGIDRSWQRFDKFDFAWPQFAHIGEQEVKNMELFFTTGANDILNNGTFGYQSRYCEYKYKSSTVHGDFRTSLNYWHMGRQFTSLPALNGSFVTADPTSRVFAVEDPGSDKILVQLYHKVDALRPLPYHSVPSL